MTRSQVSQMLKSFSDIFTDIPGRTIASHVVTLSENNPVTVPQDPVPLSCEDAVKAELKQQLDRELCNIQIHRTVHPSFQSGNLMVN